MPRCEEMLIVEDDADIREALCELLALEGYRVRTAANGREGLQRLEEMPRPPCLIVLDLFMPGMSGSDFLGALARDRRTGGDVPVVVVSAAPVDGDAVRSVRPLVREVLTKPVELEAFLSLVRQFCGTGAAAPG